MSGPPDPPGMPDPPDPAATIGDDRAWRDIEAISQLPSVGEVHLWRIDLDRATDTSDALDKLLALLAPDERARADRFAFPDLRRRFLAGRGLLRTILGGYLQCPPDSLKFSYGPFGKPMLADFAGTPAPAFNLAHSNHLALCAVAWGPDIDVGVDIERIRPLDDLMRLAERTFSPAECAALAALPAEQRSPGFFNAWTRKEAFVKATGRGLSERLRDFDVTLAPGEPARILRIAEDLAAGAHWSLASIDLGPGWAGAVAVRQTGHPTRARRPGWESVSGHPPTSPVA